MSKYSSAAKRTTGSSHLHSHIRQKLSECLPSEKRDPFGEVEPSTFHNVPARNQECLKLMTGVYDVSETGESIAFLQNRDICLRFGESGSCFCDGLPVRS